MLTTKRLLALSLLFATPMIGACEHAHSLPKVPEPMPAPPPSTSTTPSTPAPAATPSGTGSSGSSTTSSEKDEDPRARRDTIVDQLYRAYGGGDTARGLRTSVNDNHPTSTVGQMGKDAEEGMSHTVTKLDRAAFMQRCAAVGDGKQPIWAGDERTKSFFAQSDVRARCGTVAQLTHAIDRDDVMP